MRRDPRLYLKRPYVAFLAERADTGLLLNP